MIDDSAIRLRFRSLDPVLDERGRRRFAAAEALAAGYGGILAVSRAIGIARSTIQRGLAELSDEAGLAVPPVRVRRAGGGRKSLSATDTTLLNDLQSLVDPVTTLFTTPPSGIWRLSPRAFTWFGSAPSACGCGPISPTPTPLAGTPSRSPSSPSRTRPTSPAAPRTFSSPARLTSRRQSPVSMIPENAGKPAPCA